MKTALLAILISASALAKKDPPCPQLDPSKKDPDGMLQCPDLSDKSAWAVYRCAIEQATSFHEPSKAEMLSMDKLLTGWADSNVSQMIEAASDLSLQSCRVSQLKDGSPDSYLLFYTKPGVKNYSGPFLMLREANYSKVLVIGPHDDTDSTAYDTKAATAQTSAMGTISNGHRRRNVRHGANPGRNDDFVHSDGPTHNLGTYAVEKFCQIKPSSVVLHVHGMADHTKVLDRSRSPVFQAAFEKAVKEHTSLKEFDRLNAYFSIDPLVNTNWYLKTEIPVRVHNNNARALALIVKDIEEYPWAQNGPVIVNK